MYPTTASGLRAANVRLVAIRAIWVLLTALILCLFLFSIPAEYQAHLQEGQIFFKNSLATLGLQTEFYAIFRTIMDLSLALGFSIVAMIIYLRKPGDWMVMLTSLSIEAFTALFVPTLTYLVQSQPAWEFPVSFVRTLGLASSLIVFFYLIPDGRFAPTWTRWAAALWGLIVLAWFIFPNLPANLIHMKTWENDVQLSFVIFLIAYGTGIVAQVYRYQHISGPIQRQQTKWYVFGLAAAFSGFALYHLPYLIAPAAFNYPSVPRLLQIFIGIPIYHLSILSAPLCISICITRYRLWDIDHLINRTLIAGTLTALLVLVYFSSIVLLELLFRLFTRDNQDNLVTVISTLAIASLFVPLRRRVQEIIDRHFYRARYNTEQTLIALGASLRDEVDMNGLVDQLVYLIHKTMQPAEITLCLVRYQRQSTAAAQMLENKANDG